MPKAIDLTGQTIGYAYVLGVDHITESGCKSWKCKCLYKDCGTVFTRTHGKLMKHKEDANCGCLCKEKSAKKQLERIANTSIRQREHGKRIFEILHGMLQRCNNPNYSCYKDYGGRGIKVCDEWQNSKIAFYEWAMANGYADNLTLDRIDVDGDYCPENCRWVDMITQNNNRRDTIRYSFHGKTYTISELSRLVQVSESTLSNRIKKGMSIEDACKVINYKTYKPLGQYKPRKHRKSEELNDA